MRIKHIDILRGIAAILVTIFHLSGSSGLSKDTAALGHYGYLGVEMFFVISGFVLPYSLLKSGYRIQNFFTFIFKRIARIYPAYIVAIIIWTAMVLLTGREVIKWQGSLLHLLFLNSALGFDDISPVLWTLKIEFVFYFFTGLFFCYFFTSNYKSIISISVILILALFFPNAYSISWLPFFALGILVFNKLFTNMNAFLFWAMSFIVTLMNLKLHGIPEAVAGCFAVLFILFVKLEYFQKHLRSVLLWLGSISYSLYLVHWELGRSAVNASRRIPTIAGSEPIRVMLGICFSIFSAYIVYRLVEQPSMKFAHSIKYKSSLLAENEIHTGKG